MSHTSHLSEVTEPRLLRSGTHDTTPLLNSRGSDVSVETMTESHLSLNEWLYLLENRHQQEIQLGLTRVKAVAERLSLCKPDCVVITVAGTNGKGSTVAALNAIYSAAGYRVGTYTSPHLLVFNERICVNHQPISDEALCAAFAILEQARGDIHLTYFEMTTLAALYYFKQSVLDVVILEVGMGGRLDATNIIDADLAIITTIDLDHQEQLGETIEAIGFEKAGILRANQPFIYADSTPPNSITEHARALTTQMQCLGVDYSFKTTLNKLQVLRKNGETTHLPLPNINKKAAASAVVASDILLDKLCVNNALLALAMQSVVLHGRQQVVRGVVTTVFDVAHNPQSVSLLAEFIKGYQPRGKVHAVFSGLKDKDLCGLISPMYSFVDFWYLATLTGKRAASEAMLLAAFHAETGSIAPCFSHPVMAYRAAMQQADPGDLIVIYGSFLMVSAVMAAKQTGQEDF